MINSVFAFVYVVSISIQLTVIPFERYWLKFSNQFDFFASVSLAIVCALYLAPGIVIPSETIRYFNLFRLLTMLRLLTRIKEVGFIADSFVRISYGSRSILLLLFCPTAAWAIAGCHAYGGYVYAGNPKLQDSELFEANMDVLNFNDFASALMVFLVMLVTGGCFTEIIDALGTQRRCGPSPSRLTYLAFAARPALGAQPALPLRASACSRRACAAASARSFRACSSCLTCT